MSKNYMKIGIWLIMGIMLMSMVNISVNNVTANDNVVRRPPWEVTDAKPVVDITAPANGENVEDVVLVTVSASDDKGISSVILTIDGVNYDITATLQYNWDTTGLADGNYMISATATDTAGQTASDSITVEIGTYVPPPPPTGDGDKWAVIVGISDYKTISDLSFCDEDATDWYNFLVAEGYTIVKILGDYHPEDYPRWDGYATESNIRAAVAEMGSLAAPGDTCVFATSGHGGAQKVGSGRTKTYNQYLCAWDCSAGEDGYDGIIFDYEMPEVFAPLADMNAFLFFDHCYSGGFYDEPLPTNWFITTTCTDDGYGYDQSSVLNGAWTYYFLEYTLMNNPTASMEDTYSAAAAVYPYDGGDAPMMFDGNPSSPFYL